MKRLNLLLLFIIVFTNSIAQLTHSSPPDSTKLYETPIWKMWQVVHMAQQAAVADTLIRYQAREINKGLRAQIASDSLLDIKTWELVSERRESKDYKGALTVQEGLTEEAKKEKWKWVKIAIAAILVSAIELIALVVQ